MKITPQMLLAAVVLAVAAYAVAVDDKAWLNDGGENPLKPCDEHVFCYEDPASAERP